MAWIIRQRILYNTLELSSRTVGLYNHCCVLLWLLLWLLKKDDNGYNRANLAPCFVCQLHPSGIKLVDHFHLYGRMEWISNTY